MKFLVLALCVCAASAASVDYKNAYYRGLPVATPVIVKPAVVEAKPVDSIKVVEISPVAKPEEPIVPVPVVAKVPVASVPAAASARSAFNTGRYVFEPVPVTQKYYKDEKYHQYDTEATAPIVRSIADVGAEGFNYGFETGNGIVAESSGALKEVDGAAVLVTRGYYQYYAPDGQLIKVEYEADENGFRPRSDILPVGPEVPVAIQRSLEFIAAHPPKPAVYPTVL